MTFVAATRSAALKDDFMTISLTPEVEQALAEAARRQGTTPELLALDCLREHFVSAAASPTAAAPEGTLADFLAGHIGVLSSTELVPGGAHFSEDTGAKFAAGLVQQRAQGRLTLTDAGPIVALSGRG
jgi:hypothetical protein